MHIGLQVDQGTAQVWRGCRLTGCCRAANRETSSTVRVWGIESDGVKGMAIGNMSISENGM